MLRIPIFSRHPEFFLLEQNPAILINDREKARKMTLSFDMVKITGLEGPFNLINVSQQSFLPQAVGSRHPRVCDRSQSSASLGCFR